MIPARQTTLKIDNKPRKKKEHFLTDAEKEKIERHRQIKSQFATFSQLHPEYVERNSIKYPIPDQLLAKYPQLNNYQPVEKPEPFQIDMTAEEFEQILYIWEFCNNFSEFLDTPSFKMEELRAALVYKFAEDERMEYDEEEFGQMTWNEQMEVRHIREKGFHIFNRLHSALADCFL